MIYFILLNLTLTVADIKIPNFENPDLEPISGMDATFLYMERHNSPMHVGSVIVMEGSLDFATFRKTLLSRMHQIPKLRKKLVYVPLSVDYPYWADDPDFDIDMHLSAYCIAKTWRLERIKTSGIRCF